MNESFDLNAFIVLGGAYFVLRIWLTLPPSDGRETGDAEKAASVPDAKSPPPTSRHAPLPLANDNRQPGRLAKASRTTAALDRIRAAAEHFDKKAFLSGASQAYELVVNAFAEGDTATLDSLIGTEAAATLRAAVDERRERGESLTLNFIGFRKLHIADAWFEAGQAEITVRFDSELVRVTRAADNTVVDGDPAKIVTVTDLWTFARRLPSRNPNWTVVATEGGQGISPQLQKQHLSPVAGFSRRMGDLPC